MASSYSSSHSLFPYQVCQYLPGIRFVLLPFCCFVHVKVMLRAVCMAVVAVAGETELLLQLLTSFEPFKKVRAGGVGIGSQQQPLP